MLDDGVQLLVQPGFDDLGQGVAVLLLGPLPGDGHQLLLGPLDKGREVAPGHRPHLLDLVGDEVGVFHHHLEGLFLPQIGELLQHLRGGAHIQGRLVLRVGEALAGHNHLAEVRVFGVFKVHVAGGHHGLSQLLPNPDDGAVVFPQPLDVRLPVSHHEHVVADGLDLQVVVVAGDLAQVLEGVPPDHGPKELPGLAGAAHKQPLPVLVQQALGGAGGAVEVLQMPGGDEPVQVLQAGLVLHQQDHVVGPELFGVTPGQSPVDLVHPLHPVVGLQPVQQV